MYYTGLEGVYYRKTQFHQDQVGEGFSEEVMFELRSER